MMLSVQRDHIPGQPVRRAARVAPVLTLLLLLCGCARDRQITEITLERRGCLGPCRIYKVTLRRDGSAVFVGKQNVERIGTFTNDTFWPVTFQFNRLADAVDRAGFFHLAGQYSGGFVDAEVVVTTVTSSGKAKTVTTHNSSKDPKELWQVDTLIDGIAAGVIWKRQE
jgi:hypothetical protein